MSDAADRRPSHASRLAVALVVALGVATLVYLAKAPLPPGEISSDFQAQWFAARVFWAGGSAYDAVGPGPGRELWWNMQLPYPATTFVALGPLVRLPLHVAEGAFAAVGAALLARTLTRRSWAPLAIMLSWPVHFALNSGQWSPLIAAAAAFPSLAWLVAAKPTIGLAAAAYGVRRSWIVSAVLGGLALAGVAWAIDPGWVPAWWAAAHAPAHASVGVAGSASLAYVPLVGMPGGAVALLALLRWRRPEARLLAVFACVPHTMSGYELVLLLALVPDTLVEATVLALLSWGLAAVLAASNPHPDLMTGFRIAGLWSVAFVLVPCTLIVLRRPNVGEVPAWLEHRIARVPLPWLRGRPA